MEQSAWVRIPVLPCFFAFILRAEGDLFFCSASAGSWMWRVLDFFYVY